MLQKICEEHTLPLCTVPFHEGGYEVNQFLDLTDFIIIIRNDFKNLWAALITSWHCSIPRRRIRTESILGPYGFYHHHNRE